MGREIQTEATTYIEVSREYGVDPRDLAHDFHALATEMERILDAE